MRILQSVAAVLVLLGLGSAAFPARAADEAATTSKVPASSVATFHCLSLYWSPEKGEAGKKVLVKFREAGQSAWREGLAMRHNPVASPECKADYRGSLVNLKPGTVYEIHLALEGTDVRTTLKASTWNETFPVASTVPCKSGNTTLNITKSGTPDGYVLYDGTGCVIDCENKADLGISVDASYVILRGFTIKNVKQHGIRLMNGRNIVLEQCDVSTWGSEEEKGFGFDYQGAVFSNKKDLRAVVIQRCKFHHPTWDSNSWAEDHNNNRHPAGPQAIVFWESEGNHVFRYNECWSDEAHYFNDVLGAGNNGSYRGFPGADSDIYGNYIANCWDDGIEAEGGNQNVRIWNNYIENTMMTMANAATSIGPLYVWRNVGGRSYSPPGSSWDLTHGNFMKMGFAGSETWMTGHMYFFHNTVFQPKDEGANGLGGDSRVIKHCVTRNNIFQARAKDSHSISTEKKSSIDNDFDFDLLSGRFPEGHEKHGIQGVPKYVADAGFSFETKSGNFQQAPDSPGIKKGEAIPNFGEGIEGPPDLGAHQAGTPPLVYGCKAEFVPPGSASKPAATPAAGGAKETRAPAEAAKIDPSPHRDALVKALQSEVAKKKAKVTLRIMGGWQDVPFEGADASGVTVLIAGNRLPLPWKGLSSEDFVNLGLMVCGEDAESVFHAGALAAAERLEAPARKAEQKLMEMKSEKAKELAALLAP
ncbi:MAG: right-handed parallel beta-helix repeat-containing protein [Planctomycetota bacterium]|nr:right-handed parallel beta-helix repeat-containing protein [Planctomycetota bacterium]